MTFDQESGVHKLFWASPQIHSKGWGWARIPKIGLWQSHSDFLGRLFDLVWVSEALLLQEWGYWMWWRSHFQRPGPRRLHQNPKCVWNYQDLHIAAFWINFNRDSPHQGSDMNCSYTVPCAVLYPFHLDNLWRQWPQPCPLPSFALQYKSLPHHDLCHNTNSFNSCIMVWLPMSALWSPCLPLSKELGTKCGRVHDDSWCCSGFRLKSSGLA